MALTGVQIYKFLPKTNCKECGFPTCLSFAMKLAQRATELGACPYVSDEAKSNLEAASRPPVRLVTVGVGEKKIEVGNEVVLFRHEKTFVHPAGLVLRVKDSDADAVAKAKEAAAYSVERVGINMYLDGIAIENDSKDAAKFAKLAADVKAATDVALILMSSDTAAMKAALEKVGEDKPLIYAATADNADAMIELAKKYSCPLAVYGNGLQEVADLTEQAAKAGVEDLVIDPATRGYADSLDALTQIRRLAIKKSFVALGYPVITFPGEGAESIDDEAMLAGMHIAKYASIIVLDNFSPAVAYPLLTARLNIYTDPQKPIQMAAGVYPLGDPKADSVLCVTTNFSLTYFSIAGELENSGYPSHLLVCDTEGLSVLTAWAAGKFDAEKIAKAVKEFKLPDTLSHKKIILPGGVAVLKGDLEDELPDWEILVGPREAMAIGSYLKQNWS
ncbi:MAG: acetyl-CoA decarbonylase/synthase complex subunit gamma [Chloroflexi bacterium]|jgi:acetyl-CoA decarbonylase/synthase, CODH/ACS complex subunit gamma|nr:acetyl-CoA decarbonylase/synthase complex subunit gamma [Chloroflexota bacterium]MBT7081861.1 acetyl-CoA decarbonylase/synthase complex subunit gamma [Chloroflexota bacterium]MBT7289456.1 acetyl-CoA decarbonylase/synthase complex subunit gamma [Chloroflexota bacterium]